ncbi:MAG TPA: UvrD-helicase domain-containing protein [Bdellovibrionales bacterium]|nr:UvrD-helicase domain-containing protein [Bdellovibrionales bacterium]
MTANRELFAKELNPVQFEAVNCLEGPLLILAGAGSGKTRVLTYRMANLIAQGLCRPDEIFAVTFTNKAARSMRERTYALLQKHGIQTATSPWVSTFHSACARILRDHIGHIGYDPRFAIYDDSDQMAMIKKVCERLGLNDKMYPPRSFQGAINDAKNKGISPEEYARASTNFLDEKKAKVYALYETEMKKSNALDFGDLLSKTYELMRTSREVLDYFQNTLRFIMVDEYQDTNHIQYQLVHLLSEKHRNLCVVGDEDQSIYSWRGADITNILSFESDYPEAKVIKLEQNYRSTQTIVKAASEVIKNNFQRKDKSLFTENDLGSPIILREEFNEYKEAQFVSGEVKRLLDSGDATPNEVAVFYRTNAQSRVLEDQFRMQQIPFRIIGAVTFYERQEIKDLLSYMKFLVNPRDDLALKRIINRPPRRIGKTTIEKLEEIGANDQISMVEAAERAIQRREVHSGAMKGLTDFLNQMAELQDKIASATPSEAYQAILDTTGYIEMLRAEDSVESQSRIENLEELYNAIGQFEKERAEEATLVHFIEEMALVTDLDRRSEDEETVTLMTLHLSKGLEFPYVFIVGMEEGLFPSRQSFDNMDPTRLEEERRLAYVGMTRAEKQLWLTHARQRFFRGAEERNPPSRFLKEIPEKYLEKQSAIPTPRLVSSFQERYQRSSPYQSGQSRSADIFDAAPDYESFSDDQGDQASFKKGMKVRHPHFGIGIIFSCEGEGENQKVTVMFDDRSLKKFSVKFARLDRVN